MTPDLFSDEPRIRVRENVDDGVVLLPGIGAGIAEALMSVVTGIAQSAPFRHMTTPGGFRMSVATANCGSLGWISDHRGYRYSPLDPVSGRPWPAMPAILADLATSAAATAGFTGFLPDACLINRYDTGTRMSLHQDRNERDFSAPIVSLSLGVTATFQLGGGET